MTTALKPEIVKLPDQSQPTPVRVTLAGREDAFRKRPLKTKEVEIPGRGTFRFRELYQGERELIDAPLNQNEADANTGVVKIKSDQRLYKARCFCYSWVDQQGQNVCTEPEKDAEELNKTFTGPEMDLAFNGPIDELNLLTRGAQERAGKASGKTSGAAG